MNSTLLIVDAMSVAYRAFYAITGLSTVTGRPTNAVYGFIKTLGHVARVWDPTHWVVAFDGGIPRARTDLLKEYKAQRPAMPDSLREQLPVIEEYLDCAAIKFTRMEGEEADDVMASIASVAEMEGMNVLLLTGDKDLMQIVDKNVSVVFPGSSGKKAGPAEVFDKIGVMPCQVVDFLALAGDSSDNIPGVPGVGVKTAAKWLNEWGSIELLWAHIDDLKPEKLRLALVDNREIVIRNIKMMTLNRRLNCLSSLDDTKRRTPDVEQLITFYEKLDFNSLAENLKAPYLL